MRLCWRHTAKLQAERGRGIYSEPAEEAAGDQHGGTPGGAGSGGTGNGTGGLEGNGKVFLWYR